MDKFIKVYSYGSVLHIVNIDSIAMVNEKDQNALLTLKVVDKNGINIQVIDAIKGLDYYKNLLVDNAANNS